MPNCAKCGNDRADKFMQCNNCKAVLCDRCGFEGNNCPMCPYGKLAGYNR
ncbi:MAG: hypothetical protein AABW86_01425 [Candidatus Micrarchaeota archaeon]